MRSRLLSLCALALCMGCSLANKFDDLKPIKSANGGAGGATAGTGGSAGGGTGGTSGGGSGGTSGTAGGGGSSGAPQDGLVVVSGQVASTTPVLNIISVISPWSGRELARTNAKATVRAIVYDGDQDLWYVFYSNMAFGINASLSIGRFNLTDGKFVDLTPAGAPLVPVPFDQNQIAVLKNRIVYVAASSAIAQGVSMLDTSPVASKPSALPMGNPVLGPLPSGGVSALLAHPSQSVSGGTITVVQQNQVGAECVPESDAGAPDGGAVIKDCPVKVLSATVSAGAMAPSYGTPVTIGTVRDGQWSAGWVSDGLPLGNDYILLPPKDYSPTSTGSLYSLFSTNLAQIPTPKSFPFTGPRISSTTFDPCRSIVFAGELKTVQTITAIPTGAGTNTPASVQEGKSVQHLTYEPFTQSLIMTFDDANNPAFDAWGITGSDTMPGFTQRKGTATGMIPPWGPPKDLVPKFIAVKMPSTAPCP